MQSAVQIVDVAASADLEGAYKAVMLLTKPKAIAEKIGVLQDDPIVRASRYHN
jgi:hypothetical protein